MKKKQLLICILAVSMLFSFNGCRSKVAETETETTSETQSETESESQSEVSSERETSKNTEKNTAGSASSKKTGSTEKTTVKPSTVKSNTAKSNTTKKAETNKQTETNQTETNQTASGATQMCPYCYQQISTASNGQGSTIYADHVAQEKAWSEYMASSNTQTTPSTESQTSGSNSATSQCPYCYQYFTVSDGSYQSHIDSENSRLGLPDGSSEYITCPLCRNTYAKGIEYDTHYCTGINYN